MLRTAGDPVLHFRVTTEPRDCDWRHLLASYTACVSPTSTVLEIGASEIHLTQDLSRHCRQLIGVDIHPEHLADDFDNVVYRVADWQRLTDVLTPESIDVVVASHTLEHVPDDRRALAELHHVLRPGGVAILNTPNRKRLVRAVAERIWGERKFPHRDHVREYTEEDLRRLIRGSPFHAGRVVPVFLGIHQRPVSYRPDVCASRASLVGKFLGGPSRESTLSTSTRSLTVGRHEAH